MILQLQLCLINLSMEIREKKSLVPQTLLQNTKIKDFILILFILIFFITTLFFYFSYHKVKKDLYILTDPQAQETINKVEAEKLITEISEFMTLPEETPVVGTIKDVDNLVKTQKFFVGSQNGDKILIYKDKAVIYRPETKKIINVGPVYIEANNETVEDISTSTTSDVDGDSEVLNEMEEVSVEVRNGSGVTGAASNLGTEIESIEGYILNKVGDAVTTTYSGTWLVNLTGKNIDSLSSKIEDVQVIDKLPEGEENSLADVVIIIGSN